MLKKKISLFKFPQDQILALKWMKAIKKNNFTPNSSSRVCAVHFIDQDYQMSSSDRQIQINAVDLKTIKN